MLVVLTAAVILGGLAVLRVTILVAGTRADRRIGRDDEVKDATSFRN